LGKKLPKARKNLFFSWQIIEFLTNLLEFLRENCLSFFGIRLELFSKCPKKACSFLLFGLGFLPSKGGPITHKLARQGEKVGPFSPKMLGEHNTSAISLGFLYSLVQSAKPLGVMGHYFRLNPWCLILTGFI